MRICCLLLAWMTAGALGASTNEPGLPPRPLRMALVLRTRSNPYDLQIETGARDYARQKNIQLDFFGPEKENDAAHQISIIESLIKRDYQAIVLLPVDSQRLIPVCLKATALGIPVIIADNPLDPEALKETGLVLPFCGSDDATNGHLIATAVAKRLGGKGRVILLAGRPSVVKDTRRMAGMAHALQSYPDIRIAAMTNADWRIDHAFIVVNRLWREGGPVEAILCANDRLAIGAARAMAMQQPAGHVLISGSGNIGPAREELRNGRIHFTMDMHPYDIGIRSVEAAEKSLAGFKPLNIISARADLITDQTFGRRIGFAASDLREPFVAHLVRGARDATDLFGMFLLVRDAGGRAEQQAADIAALAASGCDGIVVDPAEGGPLLPAIRLARSNAIPVVTVDRTVPGADILAHAASDETLASRNVVNYLATRLTATGRIVTLAGPAENPRTGERSAALRAALAARPGLKLAEEIHADNDGARAQAATARLLAKGAAFDALIAYNDAMILGALEALEQAHVAPPPLLVAYDGRTNALVALRQRRLAAVAEQRPEALGDAAVRAFVQSWRGDLRSKNIGGIGGWFSYNKTPSTRVAPPAGDKP